MRKKKPHASLQSGTLGHICFPFGFGLFSSKKKNISY